MKAADIPDEVFLLAARTHMTTIGASRWDIGVELSRLLDREIPEKIVIAKARRLCRRGVLDGCWCGCRGDFRFADDP